MNSSRASRSVLKHENEEHASDTQQLQSNTDDENQPDLLKANEAEVPSAGTGQSK